MLGWWNTSAAPTKSPTNHLLPNHWCPGGPGGHGLRGSAGPLHVAGHVARISPPASTLRDDVLYSVAVALDPPPEGFRLGMSAEVRIVTE